MKSINLKIHHVGYLVKNIEKSKEYFNFLGFIPMGETVYDGIRKINISFLKNDDLCIELVQPMSEESVVFNLLKKYKNSPYHICFSSFDFENDIVKLKEMKYVQIDNPEIAPAINNKRVVFMVNSSAGIIELIEE